MTRFRVCGNREVLDHLPGEEFDADISDIQEERLVAGGHIERVDGPPTEGGDENEPELPDFYAGDDQEKE